MRGMFRVHSSGPRDYLLVQTNPDLKPGTHTDGVHPSHFKLGDESNDFDIQTLVDHSRTTISNYLYNGGKHNLKSLICAVNEVFEEGKLELDSVIDDETFRDYLCYEKYQSYRKDLSNPPIGEKEGFFGDFAYTNVIKHQAPRNRYRRTPHGIDWFEDELKTISPEIAFSMGDKSMQMFKRLGFEKVAESQFSTRVCGKILSHDGDSNGVKDRGHLQDISVVQLHHLDFRSADYSKIIQECLMKVSKL